jgi:hypothetical protein
MLPSTDFWGKIKIGEKNEQGNILNTKNFNRFLNKLPFILNTLWQSVKIGSIKVSNYSTFTS